MDRTISSLSYPVETKSNQSGWRVLLVFVILYAMIWIVNLVMGVFPNMLMKWLVVGPNTRAWIGSTFTYGVRIAAVYVLPALALKKVLRINPWSMFFPINKNLWKNLLYGFLLVTFVLTGFFIFEVRSGWLIVESWQWQNLPADAWLRTAWVGFLVNLSVAVGEESIFRGYLLTGLRNAWGKVIGLALMMLIFGLFHLPAYFESGLQSTTLAFAILLASLFGLLFGLIYLRTGSLWLPVMLHFTWNFVETDLFNLSADPTNPNLIGASTRLQGPLSLSTFGWGNVVVLEIMAFMVIALGIWLWLGRQKRN